MKVWCGDIKTFGRTTIYANYTEEQILSANDSRLKKIVIDIISNSASIHDSNNAETIYWKNFLYGDQDIYRTKIKHTRPEINNTSVENWAWALVDFKKAFLVGKPIQYVQLDESSEELSILNRYCKYVYKQALDLDAYGDVLTCGRAFRYINKNAKFDPDEDNSPFELLNCLSENTEVVYSSRLGNEQLLSYIVTDMEFIDTSLDEQETKYYKEYTVYTRTKRLVVNNKFGDFTIVGKIDPLSWNEHIIIEYFTNPKRISMLELGRDLFNDINYLESMDKDDMEQFVNAIMVFTNAAVSKETFDEIKQLGAVNISSTENKKASVELLQARLNATDTQTYYNRLLNSLHQILGIPMASDSGTVTYGDTGKAKMTGQGYTSAGIRAENDETMLGKCDRSALKVMLKIARETESSEIKSLKVANIDLKFQRDMSDNLLVKTQALLNMYSADIPREFANSIVNLFSDPTAITKQQESLFGEQISQQSGKNSAAETGSRPTNESSRSSAQNTAEDQVNTITNTMQKDLQGA